MRKHISFWNLGNQFPNNKEILFLDNHGNIVPTEPLRENSFNRRDVHEHLKKLVLATIFKLLPTHFAVSLLQWA